MTDLCVKCSSSVPPQERYCQICGKDAGFPNVRYAQRPEERAALAARVAAADTSASAKGSSEKLNAFGDAVGASEAVMNRWLGTLNTWVNGDNPLYVNFYKQVRVLGRMPEQNDWDRQRGAAEELINPYIHEELNLAALTLDGIGMPYYGDYSVVLRSATIEDRSTVFEENPFKFNERHHVVGTRPPPAGYRAPWEDRSLLAKAKLHSRIETNTPEDAFPDILMGNPRGEPDCDFIEVQIYGSLHRAVIGEVRGPVPKSRQDRAIWKSVAARLRKSGAVVEEVA